MPPGSAAVALYASTSLLCSLSNHTTTNKRRDQMNKGDRVETPLGPGTVAYVRMAPPDYADYAMVAAVSVVLDHCRETPGYEGTVFGAANVKLVTA